METGGEKRESAVKRLGTEELKAFIREAIEDRHLPHRQFKIGTIHDEAKKRVEAICGEKVRDIEIDNHSIIHALKKPEHNLEAEDLLLAVDVINHATDIELSERKHRHNKVLTFRKDIDGEITFLTEVHVKNESLFVFNAWRQKKARNRRSPHAT